MTDDTKHDVTAKMREAIEWCLARSNERGSLPEAYVEKLRWALHWNPAPAQNVEPVEPPLDWSNFEGPKRNIEWKPDDQDLIYTAINFRDDEWGDADEDAGQQIVERVLAAWRSAVIAEQLASEKSARLLKFLDGAETALRLEGETSRQLMIFIERMNAERAGLTACRSNFSGSDARATIARVFAGLNLGMAAGFFVGAFLLGMNPVTILIVLIAWASLASFLLMWIGREQ